MFTRYEINFIAVFPSTTRLGKIDDLEYLTSALTNKKTEFFTMAQSTISKLKEISDDDFFALDLRPDFAEALKVYKILEALDELEKERLGGVVDENNH